MKKDSKDLGNWKQCPAKGWPYKGDAPNDPQYIKERDKVLKENGNGWWWFQGKTMWRYYYEQSKGKKRNG